MNQTLLDEITSDPESKLMRFTVDQYQRLIEDGVIVDGANYELLDGFIVHKNRADIGADEMIHSPRHSRRLAKLTPILGQIAEKLGLDLYCQLPIQISEKDAPEPDFSLVMPLPDEAVDRHPLPSEVVLIVEVSLSSLNRDRDPKLKMYAKAAIPEYWIINLAHQQLEVFRSPNPSESSYEFRTSLRTTDTVAVTGPTGVTVQQDVSELLQTP